jgi:hypothetical protein
MKDKKFILLFILSSVMVIASFVFLGILVSRYTNDVNDEKISKTSPTTAVITNDNQRYSDSLKNIYQLTINSIDPAISSALQTVDTSNGKLDSKLKEYYTLKNEITVLLDKKASIADLNIAKQKIELLQSTIQSLRNRNDNMKAENKRLYTIIQNLSKQNDKAATVARGNGTSGIDMNASLEKAAENTIFEATDLKIAAVKNTNEGEYETSKAENAEKIVGSFYVRTSKPVPNSEVMIIMLQPNGEVLSNSAWESGMFNTKDGSRKIYSLKLRFDYHKGEMKPCNFSLNAENLQKGKYILQVYHKGTMIANSVKSLS